jgi:hypothetical protein
MTLVDILAHPLVSSCIPVAYKLARFASDIVFKAPRYHALKLPCPAPSSRYKTIKSMQLAAIWSKAAVGLPRHVSTLMIITRIPYATMNAL